MDGGWLAEWRRTVQGCVESVAAGFEDRHGYQPGVNAIENPDEQAYVRLATDCSDVPPDLVTMFRAFGAVNLPDIGNGIFVHDAGTVADHNQAGELRRVTRRHTADVLVFASDGGGTMYALGLPDGSPVYRLPADLVVQGLYESDQAGFDVVAADLAGFLDQVREAVERFASTGEVTHL